MSNFADWLVKNVNSVLSTEDAMEADLPMDESTRISREIADAKEIGKLESAGKISDGYHTFDELYHHRAILFATILNNPKFSPLAWKARVHEDGTMYDGMFIVGIETPDGSATYHYDVDPYWDMFHVKELKCAPHFDGHTPAMAIERIKSLWKLYA